LQPESGRNSLWITAPTRATRPAVAAAPMINAEKLPFGGGRSALNTHQGGRPEGCAPRAGRTG
jgi:hypothetical protein